jgi:hypothetical protein
VNDLILLVQFTGLACLGGFLIAPRHEKRYIERLIWHAKYCLIARLKGCKELPISMKYYEVKK